MFDLVNTAHAVGNWSALGVQLPPSLKQLLDTLEQLRWAEVPDPEIDVDKLVKSKDVAAELERIATELATVDKGLEAKQRASYALARKVIREASEVVPDLIEQLRPAFAVAAAKYADAISKLPDDITAEALVTAGPDALVALGEAREAVATLATIDQWLVGLTDLPAYAGVPADRILRILAPANYVQLVALTTAADDPSHDRLALELNPVWLTAVRLGVPFEIHDPREAASVREQVEATRPDTRGRIASGRLINFR